MTKKTIVFSLLIALMAFGGIVETRTIHALDYEQAETYTAELDDDTLYHIIRGLPSDKRDELSVTILSKDRITKQDEQVLLTIGQSKADDTVREGLAGAIVRTPIVFMGLFIVALGLVAIVMGVKNRHVNEIRELVTNE